MGWQLIESQSLQSSAASVTFSSIPQTYKALKLVVSARLSGTTGAYYYLAINGATSNMSFRAIRGSGSGVDSRTGTSEVLLATQTQTASTFGSLEITFPNYSSTSLNKAFYYDAVNENNATAATQELQACLWSNTSAITSLTLQDGYYGGTSLVFGSTFTLYGLA